MEEDNCYQMASGIASNLQRLFQFSLAHLYDSATLSKKRSSFVECKGKKGKYRSDIVTCSPNYPPLIPQQKSLIIWDFLFILGEDDGE